MNLFVKACFTATVAMLLATAAQAQTTYQQLTDRAAAAIEADSLLQAEQYIRQALALEPANAHNAMLFSNLGLLQQRRGENEKALESFNFALNFAPMAVPILLNRAALYMETGRLEWARKDYALVLDREPAHLEARLMRAYIYAQAHDYKSARSDYEYLLKLQPLSYSGRLGLATLCQKEGKCEEALNLISAMIANPRHPDRPFTPAETAVLYVARADMEHSLGHLDLALIDIEEALNRDKNLPEAYVLRGRIHLKQNLKQAAKQDFEQARALGVSAAELREITRQQQ